jgi:putative colanic acid biosynthesis acetyltransferase WcaF
MTENFHHNQALRADKFKPLEGGPSFPLRHRAYRGLWIITWFLLARWTPPFMHGWRRMLLCLFGAKIAPGAFVRGSVRIWYPPNLVMHDRTSLGPGVNCYNMAKILLEEGVVVSQGAHLCAGTHDIDDPDLQLFAKPIRIGARAWIAAEAFVGPGLTVGEGAVLGARGVAFRDLEPWTVYVGNPARPLKSRRVRF